MSWKHPLTGLVYDSQAKFVQALADAYLQNVKDKHAAAVDEEAIIEALLDEVHREKSDVKQGSVVLSGLKDEIKLTLKLNASYPKDRGEQHPLRALMVKFPELSDLIRVEYKESGKSIESLVHRAQTGKLKPSDNPELAQALLAVRTEKPGKPGVVVQAKKDGE